MKSAQRERAIELRITQKLGYKTIAEQVKVSKSTLSRWLEDLPLSAERTLELRRTAWSKGEASREQFRETMRAKRDKRDQAIYLSQKKKFARISSQSLFIAGLMLYAAEGDKKAKADIAFTNTDPVLILFFVRWIVRFLGFPKTKLRIQLHLYENMDIQQKSVSGCGRLACRRSSCGRVRCAPYVQKASHIAIRLGTGLASSTLGVCLKRLKSSCLFVLFLIHIVNTCTRSSVGRAFV